MVSERLAAPGRIYAVGDVHGQAAKLRDLHRAIRADLSGDPVQAPLLIHLGDYIDRGPDSAGCIDVLAATPLEGVATVNLMGNHERMLLDALERPQRGELWLQNGGDVTLASWGIPVDRPPAEWRRAIPPAHLQFLEHLTLSHSAGRFLFVHAGVRPGIRLAMQAPEDMLWIRDCFLDWNGTMLPDEPDRIIVHGHTPVAVPDVRRNRIGIDTNAGRGGMLTCAALSADSVYFLQV